MRYDRETGAGTGSVRPQPWAWRGDPGMVGWLRLGVALTLAVFVTACSVEGGGRRSKGADLAPLAARAPQLKGKLTIYSALDRTTIEALTTAFQRTHPDV